MGWQNFSWIKVEQTVRKSLKINMYMIYKLNQIAILRLHVYLVGGFNEPIRNI